MVCFMYVTFFFCLKNYLKYWKIILNFMGNKRVMSEELSDVFGLRSLIIILWHFLVSLEMKLIIP